jgi:hypothetical protein
MTLYSGGKYMPSNNSPAPIGDVAADGIASFVKNVAALVFRESFNYATDFPGYLADPTPAPGPFGIAKAVAQRGCRRWARGEGLENSPAFDAFYSGACGPYLDGLGENPGEGAIAVPFDGGQCPEPYLVTYTSIDNQGTPQTTTVLANGPIGGIRIRQAESGAFVVELFCRNLQPGQSSCSTLPLFNPNWFFTGQGGAGLDGGSVSIDFVTPCGADNCGNPPPEYYPAPIPPGLPPLPPLTINIPGIGPVDVEVEFDPSGNIDVCLPLLGVCGKIQNPAANPQVGTGNTPPPGVAGDPTDTGVGGSAEGEAPEGKELEGVLIEVVSADYGPNLYQNVAVDVYRGIGYIRLGYAGRNGADVTGSVAQTRQYFLAIERGLTTWDVNANLGFNLRATPFYRDKDV